MSARINSPSSLYINADQIWPSSRFVRLAYPRKGLRKVVEKSYLFAQLTRHNNRQQQNPRSQTPHNRKSSVLSREVVDEKIARRSGNLSQALDSQDDSCGSFSAEKVHHVLDVNG